jgi:hypothetical protein
MWKGIGGGGGGRRWEEVEEVEEGGPRGNMGGHCVIGVVLVGPRKNRCTTPHHHPHHPYERII